jgi:hypothetical protein
MSITLQLKSTDKARKKFSLVMTFASRFGRHTTEKSKLEGEFEVQSNLDALKNLSVFGGHWRRAD